MTGTEFRPGRGTANQEAAVSGDIRPTERQMLAEAGVRHERWTPDAEPVVLARGTEHTTFRLDGWIVRHSEQPGAQAHEVALLRALADAVAVPVPEPLFHDRDLGLFGYRRLPGRPLLHTPGRVSRSVERGLVEVLSALRTLPAARRLPVDPYPNEDWHQDAVHSFPGIRSHLSATQRRLVQRFLDEEPPPTRAPVIPQHNDLGAEHILVDDGGNLSGIIDWSDAARADPARDLGTIYRDLGLPVAFRVSEALGQSVSNDEAARITFHARCRWIEDVSYGLRDPGPRHVYLANARRTFAHTFGAPR